MEEWFVELLNWIMARLAWVARLLRPRRRLVAGWALGLAIQPGHGRKSEQSDLASTAVDRHTYVVGASGSGKSRLLELLIRQHLQRGEGFCLIDPHGDLTRNVLAFLYEEAQRAAAAGAPLDLERLFLVEPFHEDGIVGLNPLDPGGGPLHPHISELVAILRRFWANSWGPRMEELLRNALLTLALAGYTLTEVATLLVDAEFRSRVLASVPDETIRAYWSHRYDPLSEAARMTIAEPVLNKVGALLADPRIRAMLRQKAGCLNLRRLIDQGAWVLVNCSRGQLRDASCLVGSFLVAQLQAAAMSRAGIPERDRKPFTLFVDEFQNFRGDDFETILCEARKYRLRLVIAHRHRRRWNRPCRTPSSGTSRPHRLSSLPARRLLVAKQLPDEKDLVVDLSQPPVGQALVCRRGQPPVTLRILPVWIPSVDDARLDEFMAGIRTRHGRSLKEVEPEIAARVAAPSPAGHAPVAGKRRGGRPGKTAAPTPPVAPTPPATPAGSGTLPAGSTPPAAPPIQEADDD